MIRSLLLLYARDTEHVKNDLLQRLKGVPTCCICTDDPAFSQHHALRHPAKSRLQIVFFSPGLLNFLNCRTAEAYGSFRHLDPESTVALFCSGLRETEVKCYHTASLNSFYSWPKFETVDNGGSQCAFPPYLLQIIQEAFPGENSYAERIIIVPQLISKESRHLYAIFPNVIENMPGLSIHLESRSCIQIIPKDLNPYVIQFEVPEMLLESCQTFMVKIQQSDTLLAQQRITVIQDVVVHQTVVQEEPVEKRSSNITRLDEQLQLLRDLGGLSPESPSNDLVENGRTVLPSVEDVACSLIEICKKYGLEELSSFIEETDVPDASKRVVNSSEEQRFFSGDAEIRQNVTPAAVRKLCTPTASIDEMNGCAGITRSMSLPTVLFPQEEYSNGYGDYIPMAFSKMRPMNSQSTEVLSISESCVSNSTYVCMTRHSGDALETARKGLSDSQKDLLDIMHAFKRGETALWIVERQFQLWRQNHGEECKHKPNKEKQENGETGFQPDPIFGVPRRPKRKSTNVLDWIKRFSGSSLQGRLTLDSHRKTSDASVSSTSSKTSDTSNPTLQSQQWSSSSKSRCEVSTGWIPVNSTSRFCLLDPPPPPLPTRPRPTSKNRSDSNEISRSRYPSKRNAGNHLPPIVNDLKDDKKADSEREDRENKNVEESLLQICERYGLQDLGNYFFEEFSSSKDAISENTGTIKEESLKKTTGKELMSQSSVQLTSYEWDHENTMSFRRSLSLPSTLFSTEDKDIAEDNKAKKGNLCGSTAAICERKDSVISRCEEYVNSIQSNIYMSVQAYISMQGQRENLPRNALSKSQQELLELMNAFKRGEKSISQVERQFQEWHMRHDTSVVREQQLSQLKDQYERAQKSSAFGIKKFILGKPRKKNSKAHKNSTADSKPVKHRTGKCDSSDNKRSSKISCTSTSSGVSDNGDVSKNFCYFNPSYGETIQEILRGNLPSSKPSHSSSSENAEVPPPLPPRPPLTPVAILRYGHHVKDVTLGNQTDWLFCPKDDTGEIPETEKSPAKSDAGSPLATAKKKPNPPPKPPDLFKKVSSAALDIERNQEEKQVSGPETRPDSPDYIIPNPVPRVSSKKNLQTTKASQSDATCPLQCPLRLAHTCAKAHAYYASNSCPTTMSKSQSSKKKDGASSSKAKQVEDSSQKTLLVFPNPWTKPKKTEKPMFYVTRRWSSFPDLQMSELHSQPVYLDLQELFENRNRSISDSNSPLD